MTETATAPKKRILVVDDNVDSAEMMVTLVETWGYAALHASDGDGALELARAHHPDVVLLDIGLPGKDGYQVAAMMRADPALAKTRIIAVSGYGEDSDREKSRQAGCDDHLVKPVDIPALRRSLG